MSDREVTSVNLDVDVKERLANDPAVNMSGLVNKLLREYMDGNTSEKAMLQFRADQLRTEVGTAKSTLDTKRDELGRVLTRLREIEQSQANKEETLRAEAFEEFDSISRDYLTPTNKHVKRHAEKLDMDPATLLEEYHEH
jgi:predicted  nucleic acid-binding Zn-ribbon protein